MSVYSDVERSVMGSLVDEFPGVGFDVSITESVLAPTVVSVVYSGSVSEAPVRRMMYRELGASDLRDSVVRVEVSSR